jgi:hypothetical protein
MRSWSWTAGHPKRTCRRMISAFERAARAMEPRVRLANVNTEEAQALAACSGIAGIPSAHPLPSHPGDQPDRGNENTRHHPLGQWARSGPVRDVLDSDPPSVVVHVTAYPSQWPLDSF